MIAGDAHVIFMPFPKTHRPEPLSPIAPKDFKVHNVGIVNP